MQAGTGGLLLGGAGRYRVQVEHFVDGSRNGFRVRQLGFGDPRIFSTDSDCDENPVFIDVVCNLLSPQVIKFSADSQPQEIAVGGSAQACEPATQGTLVELDTGGGNDIVRATSQCGNLQASPVSDVRTSPRFAGDLGAGNDSFDGGLRDDVIRGAGGADLLDGGVGKDILEGDADDDILLGDFHDDTLNGGSGADTLRGGSQDER